MSVTLLQYISGSGEQPEVSGSTSYGYFDSDSTFINDCKRTTKWIARKLGWPIMQTEISFLQSYDLFEESVMEYSALINNSTMQDWMLNYLGTPTSGSNFTHKFPNNKFTFLHNYADSIASEVGAGGKIDWKSGSINLVSGQQDYDIQELWGNVSESNQRISIRDVYHFRPGAAISRAYAGGFSDFALGGSQIVTDLGGSYTSMDSAYYVYPTYEDVLRANAIELNDMIRKSSYSYEIINNKIKIYPVPREPIKLWFRYTVDNFNPFSTDDSSSASTDLSSDISNVPFEVMEYSKINSMGKNWIKQWTLALAKEVLGNIRRKFDSLPIPGNDINLDGDALISDAETLKDRLRQEMFDLLEKTNTESMAERDNNMQKNINEQLDQFPMLPYIR